MLFIGDDTERSGLGSDSTMVLYVPVEGSAVGEGD